MDARASPVMIIDNRTEQGSITPTAHPRQAPAPQIVCGPFGSTEIGVSGHIHHNGFCRDDTAIIDGMIDPSVSPDTHLNAALYGTAVSSILMRWSMFALSLRCTLTDRGGNRDLVVVGL